MWYAFISLIACEAAGQSNAMQYGPGPGQEEAAWHSVMGGGKQPKAPKLTNSENQVAIWHL